ncbi:hypothetical protein CERSUDRAFT_66038 [Gelatoporia subvermispora B]|uniref:FHA domain-containing protein n=1 Tax=Ceriporiopsis subvermispora (strain B) TaxID=914234 RepID=M2RDB3_CERS8|nr:hypothetical protein CERSUDRAFT_66038 [Gelatoporia subvermispora B]
MGEGDPPQDAQDGSISSADSANTPPKATCTVRLKPDPASPDALQFDPITRELVPGQPIQLGRYFTKYGDIGVAANAKASKRVAFMTMAVDRSHVKLSVDAAGKLFVAPDKTDFATFVQDRQLSQEGPGSLLTELTNGDILQLGTSSPSGQESSHRCVRAVIEVEASHESGGSLEDTPEQTETETTSSSEGATTPVTSSSNDLATPLPATTATINGTFMKPRSDAHIYPADPHREREPQRVGTLTPTFKQRFRTSVVNGLRLPSKVRRRPWRPRSQDAEAGSSPALSHSHMEPLSTSSSEAGANDHEGHDGVSSRPSCKSRRSHFVRGETAYGQDRPCHLHVDPPSEESAYVCCFSWLPVLWGHVRNLTPRLDTSENIPLELIPGAPVPASSISRPS